MSQTLSHNVRSAALALRIIPRAVRASLHRLYRFMPAEGYSSSQSDTAAALTVPHLLTSGPREGASGSSYKGSSSEEVSTSKRLSEDLELGISRHGSDSRAMDGNYDSNNGLHESKTDTNDENRQNMIATSPTIVDNEANAFILPPTDNTHHQYLPSFISKPLLFLLGLPIVRPTARYLAGPPKFQQRQPRLWKIPFLDAIERVRFKYTQWTRFPWVLWVFLLAWFLGTTFLTRAAWYTSNGIGADSSSWLGGTDTYWLRNDGCGLGEFTGLDLI